MKNRWVIDRGQPDFFGLRWAIRAVYTEAKPIRYALDRLLIEDGLAIATDGHRMHIYPLQDAAGVAEGLYFIDRNTADQIILNKCDGTPPWPPDWRRAWPAHRDYQIIESNESFSDYHDDLFRLIIRALGEDTGLSIKYFLDATEPVTPVHTRWTAFVYSTARTYPSLDPNDMVALQGADDRLAIMMPFGIIKPG